jgi:amino acid transporter
VRQAKRNQAIGILGSILLCGLLFAWIGQLSYKVFGYEFQGALTFNAGQHNTAYATPTTPYFPLLVYYLTSHLWLAVLIAASFVAWIYFWVPGMLAYAQRSLLAWSFDRLAPECAGYVSDKYHTPVGAIIITTAISLVLLYLYVFTTLFPTLTFILAASSAWLIATLAGCLYPYLRPVLFNTSPVAYHQVLNIPMMTIANALASFALIVVIVLLWNDPVAAGHGMNSLGTVVALYVIGSFLYVVMRRWRLRQGIDIYLAAKEIPIE